MSKNEFSVKHINEEKIVIEEEKNEKKWWLLLFWQKYGNILTIILIFLAVSLFTIGSGIALSNFYDNANKVHEIQINTIVEYINGSDLELLSTYPMTELQSDSLYEGGSIEEAKFSIKNYSDVPVRTKIVLVKNTANSTLDTSVLNYKISSTGIYGNKNNLTFDENNEAELLITDLQSMTTTSYELRLWIDEFANNSYQDKIFDGELKVYFEYIEE